MPNTWHKLSVVIGGSTGIGISYLPHFASGGVRQLLTSCDRIPAALKIRYLGALVSRPIYLVTL
jgi:hypothetical protein